MIRTLLVLLALVLPDAAAAELRGHGGPVRALAVSPDGRLALSGSFDQSAILWAVDEGAALAVWRFHDGAVNAVASLPDGRFATAGEDGRIALWRARAGRARAGDRGAPRSDRRRWRVARTARRSPPPRGTAPRG